MDKQGEYTYKNTPSSTLMASLQLGLQVSIGSIEPKPRRDILMTDFEVVDTVEFPANGSDITPAHKYRDFTFKTYSPIAFRFFREAFGILAEDYLLAMCAHPMREISNPGASGSLFYLSADDAFIIKTVQKKEAHFLQKLLPGYYLNLTQNKKTLLPKFFGLYRYKCGTVNIRIAVMNNLLPSTLKYHEKYDLKGSSYKRKAAGDELGKSSPTFKDLDFQERHPETDGGIFLLQEKYEILIRTLDRDCKVLESFGIMDYSLLLGIHNMDQARQDRESTSHTTSSGGESKDDEKHYSLVPSRIELSKNFSIISMENIPLAVEGSQASDSSAHYPEGFIQGKVKGDRVLVYLGIIDILQSYRLKKKVEHTLKSMITDGTTVSVHNPSFYARRFHEFLEKRVFQKEQKVRSSRSRKATKPLAGLRRSSVGGMARTQSMPHGRSAEKHYPQRVPHKRAGTSPSSPPLFSPPPSEGATPGKSNLKQTSQYQNTSDTMSGSNILPEIPTIEVHSTIDVEEGEEEVKATKASVKGVRFADLVDAEAEEWAKVSAQERAVTSNSVDIADVSVVVKEEGDDTEREAIEMDSVDFDKVTGTSTPLSENSPSLPKHSTSSGETFSGNSSTDTSTEHEEREEVIVADGKNGASEKALKSHAMDGPRLQHNAESLPDEVIVDSVTDATDQS